MPAIRNKNMEINLNKFRVYNNDLVNPEVYKNILKLYNNASNDNKSHILSMVAYDELKKFLKEIGFKFTKKQFENAKNKKNSNEFTLKKYKRHIPESKKTINEKDINNIKR